MINPTVTFSNFANAPKNSTIEINIEFSIINVFCPAAYREGREGGRDNSPTLD
jgi:hypothetical protein